MVHATMAGYDSKNEASAGGYQQRMHNGVGTARIQLRERKNQQHFNLVFTTSSKKPHLRWTPRLHDRFEKAVAELGGPFKATPKLVLDKMGVDGLTLLHVKSHLQKYRHGKLSESNRLMADLNIRGISMSPVEESPFAGSSSNVPIFTAFRAAFAAQITQHPTSTRTGMQTCAHMTQVQQKQTAVSTYLKSLGQRTFISCGDQATALLEMVDLLSSQYAPISGLESHSGINLERGSFTPEPMIDTKALPYCSSPGMDGWDHEEMMGYLLSQNTSLPTSNEEYLSCLQPRAVNSEATENITTFLSVEPKAPTFQPRLLDDWEIEDTGTPPTPGIMNWTHCVGDQGVFENENEGIDAVCLSWLN